MDIQGKQESNLVHRGRTTVGHVARSRDSSSRSKPIRSARQSPRKDGHISKDNKVLNQKVKKTSTSDVPSPPATRTSELRKAFISNKAKQNNSSATAPALKPNIRRPASAVAPKPTQTRSSELRKAYICNGGKLPRTTKNAESSGEDTKPPKTKPFSGGKSSCQPDKIRNKENKVSNSKDLKLKECGRTPRRAPHSEKSSRPDVESSTSEGSNISKRKIPDRPGEIQVRTPGRQSKNSHKDVNGVHIPTLDLGKMDTYRKNMSESTDSEIEVLTPKLQSKASIQGNHANGSGDSTGKYVGGVLIPALDLGSLDSGRKQDKEDPRESHKINMREKKYAEEIISLFESIMQQNRMLKDLYAAVTSQEFANKGQKVKKVEYMLGSQRTDGKGKFYMYM